MADPTSPAGNDQVAPAGNNQIAPAGNDPVSSTRSAPTDRTHSEPISRPQSERADAAATRCPCGTGDVLAACCAPILAGTRRAATAEQLMRSRYTAFATGDVDHLLRSWHPRTAPPREELAASLADGTRWLRLDVLARERGGPFDADGVVEFTARARTPEGRIALHEVSRFVREDGAWLYVDGEAGAPG